MAQVQKPVIIYSKDINSETVYLSEYKIEDISASIVYNPDFDTSKDTLLITQFDIIEGPLVNGKMPDSYCIDCAVVFLIHSEVSEDHDEVVSTNHAVLSVINKYDNKLIANIIRSYDPFENIYGGHYEEGQEIELKSYRINRSANAVGLIWSSYKGGDGLSESSTGVDLHILEEDGLSEIVSFALELNEFEANYQYGEESSSQNSYTGTLSILPSETNGFYNLKYIRHQFVKENQQMMEEGTDTLYMNWSDGKYVDAIIE